MKGIVETLSIRRYKAGYEVREEKRLTHFEDKPPEDTFTMKSAYTPIGDYIGNSKDAYRLCRRYGIRPEKANPSHKVCSIGFCGAKQKWYGWSHRAIGGFGVGDTVKEGDCTASSGWTDEYLKEHPDGDGSLPIGFQAKDLSDARRMAVAFAESVS